jgi:hypothetical protein
MENLTISAVFPRERERERERGNSRSKNLDLVTDKIFTQFFQ